MKTSLIAVAMATGALVSIVVSVPALAAGNCMDTCTTRHTACVASGKDDTACLGSWHQCKATCTAPKAAPVRTSPAPVTAPKLVKVASAH